MYFLFLIPVACIIIGIVLPNISEHRDKSNL